MNGSFISYLLHKDSSLSTHHLNLIKFPIELFEIKNELSPTIAEKRFNQVTNNYNLLLHSDQAYTMSEAIFHYSKSISFLGLKIKITYPAEFKGLSPLRDDTYMTSMNTV